MLRTKDFIILHTQHKMAHKTEYTACQESDLSSIDSHACY